MEAVGVYSLKAALVLLLFWTIYQLFLRKETFYQFNRFFLLAGILAAFFLPLVKVHYPVVEIVAPIMSSVPVSGTELAEIHSVEMPLVEQSWLSWELFLFGSYLLGIAVLLVFGMISLFKLGRIIRKNGYHSYSTYYLVDSSPYVSSFSFFRFVFLSVSLKGEREREMVLAHELVHISQMHWIDLLLSGLLKLFWWFNPLVWLYEKGIRENHEFLADRNVLQQNNRKDYFSVLASQWFHTPLFPLTNSFNYPTQLKRIRMMKKNISNPIKKFSALLLLPALAVFFWAFAEPEYQYVNAPAETLPTVQPEKTILDSEESRIEPITVSISTDLSEPQNKMAQVDAKKVKEDEVIQNDTKNYIIRLANLKGNQPLFVLDGVVVNKDSFQKLPADEIERVSLLKDASAVAIYGENAKSGVILITTKKYAADNPEIVVAGYGKQKEASADKKQVDPEIVVAGYGKQRVVVVESNQITPGLTKISNQPGVKGIIVDESGNPIVGAAISFENSSLGVVSSAEGTFVLLMPGKGLITVLYPGYKKAQLQIDPEQKGLEYVIRLEKE